MKAELTKRLLTLGVQARLAEMMAELETMEKMIAVKKPAKKKPGPKAMTPAARRKLSIAMRASWVARRKEAA
jgi:hypothetical protein